MKFALLVFIIIMNSLITFSGENKNFVFYYLFIYYIAAAIVAVKFENLYYWNIRIIGSESEKY